jgi:hypothetical protein
MKGDFYMKKLLPDILALLALAIAGGSTITWA